MEIGAKHDAENDHPQRVIMLPFLVLLAFAPLPLGGYRPLPWSFNAIAFALLVGAWAVLVLRAGARVPVGVARLAFPALAALGLAIWMACQALIGIGQETASPLWSEVAALLGSGADEGVASVNPEAGMELLMRFLTHSVVFLLAVQLGRSRRRAELIFTVLAYMGFAYAAYGLLMHLGGFDLVLWWKRWSYNEWVTSTFVNRNSYATFAGITLLCAVGLLGRSVSHWGVPRSVADGVHLFAELLERRWMMLATVCVAFSALALSGSRGGLLSFLAALLALVVVTRLGRRGGWSVWWTLIAGGSVFLLLFGLFGETTAGRLGDLKLGAAEDTRIELVRLGMRAVGDSPWVGHGGGSFPDVVQMYADRRLPGGVRWGHAHNSYVEYALEFGIPAFALLMSLFAWIVGRCVIGLLRRRRDRVYPAVGIAAAVMVGLHAMVDFSIQLPGVAIPFAAILGVAYAQSWPSRRRRVKSVKNG